MGAIYSREQERYIQVLAGTILKPFQKFFRTEASGGILLMAAAAAAMAAANSPFGDAYRHLWEITAGVSIASFRLEQTLHHWINDGLMSVFFFLVGLEIKREVLVGELRSVSRASLPLAAALGGMVVPAALYLLLNFGGEGARGWGVPMSTDIAFALGALALLGRSVPPALLVFLTALAIVDDLGAILVIALFYTEQLSVGALAAALFILALSYIINRMGVRRTLPYVLLGFALWLMLLKSGIHATVAGVLLAMTIPATVTIRHNEFVNVMERQLGYLTGNDRGVNVCPVELDHDGRQALFRSLEEACHRAQPPLERIEQSLHPWVVYVIMPLFAFANAGVAVDTGALWTAFTDPVFLGVTAGLVIGKQAGVFAFSYGAVRLGLATLPTGVDWRHIYGVGLLSGIGFTMSLFVGNLAFTDPELLATVKLAVIISSIAAGTAGFGFLWFVTGRKGRGRREEERRGGRGQADPLG
ncbi:MAG TPA: Na+/H+ antiporter NhaA [Deltaproteobacteria bacterium]|nr:Na+/H+ antiporter NhaA [Deltaproteobacteria bacterium]